MSEPVKCDEKVMMKCIHGSGSAHGVYATCNYICDTGRRRPCPAEACTEFVKGKRKTNEDFNKIF